MKQQILGTGLSGLVGSRIVELLSNEFEFQDISYDAGVDITDIKQVQKIFSANPAAWVLHLAAKTDVDSCERDKTLGKNGAAWKINVEGTRNIVDSAQATHKRLIYVSTDFVFAGTKDKYDEDDKPQPLSWYATTKYEGEKIALSDSKNIVVRIAYPYRAKCGMKNDFVHEILNRLKNGETVTALIDHVFTPTLVDDIAFALRQLIAKNTSGIYHVVGGSHLTPFKAANEIADVFGLDKKKIVGVTGDRYYVGRAPRPYKLAIKNAKISALGVHMRTFSAGIKEIVKQGVS